MIATAIIMALAFISVYFVVKGVVYQNLDKDLSFEAEKHTKEIIVVDDSIKIKNKKEWEEREHKEAQVNPVFIQVLGKNGGFMDKSPNLKENQLKYNTEASFGGSFNEILNEKPIRQIQLPIEQGGKIKGFIVAAMSLEASQMVLVNLKNILLIVYSLLLASLYFVSKYIAGRSIVPIKNVTDTTNRITKNNLNERVALPQYKDELYDLSTGINNLLQRIENALEREKQFTSDASHELRTPLATLKGTLEVLIRKPRDRAEYEDKIKFSLVEINRMTETLEQLLLLARLETNTSIQNDAVTPLATIIDDILSRHKNQISMKKLSIKFNNTISNESLAPQYFSHLILENIIGNAIKYAKENSTVKIALAHSGSKIRCKVHDEGIGIEKGNLDNLFNNFFRSDALKHKNISGNGLGLSIAKKAADAIGANIKVDSTLDVGTTFTILF